MLKYLVVVAGVTLSTPFATAIADPKRVIVLQSNGQDFRPWSEYAKTFRQELERQSPWPMVVQNFSVVLAPDGQNVEERFNDYLNALFSRDPPDLIVTFGALVDGI